MAKLSRAQQERERREQRWERYILWYWKAPKEEHPYRGEWPTHRKTFYERAQVDAFLADNPRYRARRIDKTVQTIEWLAED